MKARNKMETWDFVDEFADYIKTDFVEKLKADKIRWGDTWLKRPRKGQEERLCHSLRDRIDKYQNGLAVDPLDEESILGDLFINWIRRHHPEIWKE
jgi:hypothetical protein